MSFSIYVDSAIKLGHVQLISTFSHWVGRFSSKVLTKIM